MDIRTHTEKSRNKIIVSKYNDTHYSVYTGWLRHMSPERDMFYNNYDIFDLTLYPQDNDEKSTDEFLLLKKKKANFIKTAESLGFVVDDLTYSRQPMLPVASSQVLSAKKPRTRSYRLASPKRTASPKRSKSPSRRRVSKRPTSPSKKPRSPSRKSKSPPRRPTSPSKRSPSKSKKPTSKRATSPSRKSPRATSPSKR